MATSMGWNTTDILSPGAVSGENYVPFVISLTAGHEDGDAASLSAPVSSYLPGYHYVCIDYVTLIDSSPGLGAHVTLFKIARNSNQVLGAATLSVGADGAFNANVPCAPNAWFSTGDDLTVGTRVFTAAPGVGIVGIVITIHGRLYPGQRPAPTDVDVKRFLGWSRE